jgi:hypothetical protein
MFNKPASGLACKYKTKVVVTGSGKHSSLLKYELITVVKSFYSSGTRLERLARDKQASFVGDEEI